VAICYRLVVSRVGIRLWKRYRENGKLYEAGKYVDGKQIISGNTTMQWNPEPDKDSFS
jgi:hypothetical protein